MKIETEVKLNVGEKYNVLVINYSIGGRCFPSCPVCFTAELRYDGNDNDGIAIFSEEYFTVTKKRYSFDYSTSNFRKYNNDNFIVVGVIPERLNEDDNTISFWKNTLKVTPNIIIGEDY